MDESVSFFLKDDNCFEIVFCRCQKGYWSRGFKELAWWGQERYVILSCIITYNDSENDKLIIRILKIIIIIITTITITMIIVVKSMTII